MSTVWIGGKRQWKPEVEAQFDIICHVLSILDRAVNQQIELGSLWYTLMREGWAQAQGCGDVEFGKKLEDYGFTLYRDAFATMVSID